jgi:prepilin-type N-terminal cleavage/methylation domain-containing protein
MKRDRNRERGKSGFTLIEIMVAVALFAVITGIVYSSFFSVVESTEDTRLKAEELRLREFLTYTITNNLAQAYGDWRPGAALHEMASDVRNEADTRIADAMSEEGSTSRYWMEGVDGTGPYGPADTLTFTSSAPLTGGMALPGFMKQVTLEIQQGESDEELKFGGEGPDAEPPRLTLEMTETPSLEGPDAMDTLAGRGGIDKRDAEDLVDDVGFDAPGWSVPIRTLDIQYFDGEEWVDDWDSFEEGRLPWSIHFRINFARPIDEIKALQSEGIDFIEDPDFQMIVTIPAGMGITEPQLDGYVEENLNQSTLGNQTGRGNRSPTSNSSGQLGRRR